MLVTNMTIVQAYLVPEITNRLVLYDRLRWYRSSSGRNGFYEPATTSMAEPAVMRGRSMSQALMAKRLVLRVNGVEDVSVLFTGPNPVTATQVADAITTASPSLAVTVEGDDLEIRTLDVGTGTSIEVLDGDAAPLLGLLIGESVIGTDADSVLLPGISEYRFEDRQSSPSMFYMVEYRSSTSPRVSARSAPFQSRLLDSVPLSRLIGCFMRLADLTGRPLGGRRIFIHNVFLPNRVTADGKLWGLFREYEELVTDPNGYAEVFLVRGALIDVTISGTGFTRRITVPTAGTVVNLLDPALETRDEFGIQRPLIDFAIRTS